MKDLQSQLEEHWPPESVVVTCEVCESTILNTRKTTPKMDGPGYLTFAIIEYVSRHKLKTGHKEIDVLINKEPVMEKEIDVEITINE